MISFQNVSKSFTTPRWQPVFIFKDLTLNIKTWSFNALMGPSWTWKSTFLNLIAGLESIDSGSLIIDETDISIMTTNQVTRRRGKTVGFVFQQFHLIPQLTVIENIDLVIELNGLTRRFATQEILEKVGLAWRANEYPTRLSGWEQQRVALARAFVAELPVLLADEPTGNLDQATASRIMELMASLHQEVNNTIIMITHDQAITRYAHHQYILQDHTINQV